MKCKAPLLAWALYFHHLSYIYNIFTLRLQCFPIISTSEIRIVATLVIVQYILNFNWAEDTNLYNKVDLGFFKTYFLYKYNSMLYWPQALLKYVSAR